ncbi:MAG: hypothetical protein AMXMBFR47_14130 [Planctomycetota bacterium]
MPEPLAALVTQTIAALLNESYEGVPADKSTWYADSGPRGSLLGLLATIPAADAARAAPGRRSIAQHARHVRFHIEVTLKFLAGDKSSNNWDESWTVDARDEAAWKREVEALRSAYAALRQKLASIDWTDLTLGSAIGSVAHAAYHLGAIRQMLAR